MLTAIARVGFWGAYKSKFGGKFWLMLPDTGRKVWANFTEDTFPPSPGMIPEKSTKINNLAGPPGDGGEVLVGGKIW